MHVRRRSTARCRITRTLPSLTPSSLPDLARGSLRIEGQENDHAFALGEPGEARLEAVNVERGVSSWGFDHVRDHESFAQLLAPPLQPLQVFRHRSAHAEDKRRDLIDIANRSTPQLLDRQEHHLLDEIARRVLVAQMAKPVQPHARGKAPIQLALGRLGSTPAPRAATARARSPSLASTIVCIRR